MDSQNFRTINILKFVVPSLIGILLFMFPVPLEEGFTIPVAILAGFLKGLIEPQLPLIMTIIITFTALATLLVKGLKKQNPQFIKDDSFFNSLFNVSPVWTIIRVLGMVLALLTYFQVGPEAIWSEYTGGLLLEGLLPLLFTVFLFAGLFLPLLLNFGLLELFGALLTKFMRPVFTLPGRSSIDSLTSWLGDGTIGVLLTSKQYEEGYYTKREAAVIGTTFSIVSITFSLVVISEVKLTHMFGEFYLTIAIAGIIAAIIMPRIPPLSRIPDTYYNGEAKGQQELIPAGTSSFKWGLSAAVKRARQNQSVPKFFQDGGKNVLDMWMGVIPIVMTFGTIALVLAENTPVFQWLGMPFIPILELLQIPEAREASATMIVGFADMFLPAIIGSGIESELTRFVIACVSVTQLIYLSEVGGVLLGSKVPISLKNLFIIFILRTLITLPVIAAMAHLFF
ncbi:YjiH family protein [Bacillus alkalisoli]|uniref:YjiH family protein n=1 Tax=Bacillus alkalisoli TaxID=2011008 RepID=UPI000C25078B|nr:YjiH family protein [Bacillus alkalisoli]